MYRIGLLTCAIACAGAQADIVGLSGSVDDSAEQTGATFSGAIEYLSTGGGLGDLIISLANDTPVEVGGFLTGFVFNIDSADPAAAATLVSATNPNFLDTGGADALPFGFFDAGAALGGNWSGGGAPSGGIGPGAFGVFTFRVSASDADLLTASSFLSGPNEFDFVVRFRGLADGGSDKVPVPTPGALAALGIAGAFGARRRR